MDIHAKNLAKNIYSNGFEKSAKFFWLLASGIVALVIFIL